MELFEGHFNHYDQCTLQWRLNKKYDNAFYTLQHVHDNIMHSDFNMICILSLPLTCDKDVYIKFARDVRQLQFFDGRKAHRQCGPVFSHYS